jgi:hypothetical protein
LQPKGEYNFRMLPTAISKNQQKDRPGAQYLAQVGLASQDVLLLCRCPHMAA